MKRSTDLFRERQLACYKQAKREVGFRQLFCKDTGLVYFSTLFDMSGMSIPLKDLTLSDQKQAIKEAREGSTIRHLSN